MSKFSVGDKVVVRAGYWAAKHFSKSMFYAVLDLEGPDIVLVDDDGEELLWNADNFDLFDPKEAANHIAPVNPIQYYIPLIEQWGRDRGILDNSTPLGQSRKTHEEVRELIEAAAKMQAFMELVDGDIDYRFDSYEKELADAIGDIFVTLVMVAGCAKLDINACVAQAYETIKNRTGRLNSQGVWEKDV